MTNAHLNPYGADLALSLAGPDSGVRIVHDTNTGAVAIVLSVDAVDALRSFLDDLPQQHDLDADGYDPNGVDVILTIRGMLLH